MLSDRGLNCSRTKVAKGGLEEARKFAVMMLWIVKNLFGDRRISHAEHGVGESKNPALPLELRAQIANWITAKCGSR